MIKVKQHAIAYDFREKVRRAWTTDSCIPTQPPAASPTPHKQTLTGDAAESLKGK